MPGSMDIVFLETIFPSENYFDHQKTFLNLFVYLRRSKTFHSNPKIILRIHENEFKCTETVRLWIFWIFGKDGLFYPLSVAEIGEGTLKYREPSQVYTKLVPIRVIFRFRDIARTRQVRNEQRFLEPSTQ